MVLAAMLATPIRAVGAQQICKPATEWADRNISLFLTLNYSQDFRQSRGIVATNVSQLQPLNDANDAALCRRMDSTMATLPAHYYRSDSTIIGTLASTQPAARGRRTNAPLVFAYDAAGTLIFYHGMAGPPPPSHPAAPADLRATVSMPGVVRIDWSNSGTPPVSYQLQRADSVGTTFGNIGTTLSASAYHGIDSTAVTGGLYRYRLRAIWSSGFEDFSNVVMHRPIAGGTLARASSGLLYYDNFNRANGAPGAGWAIESGSWAINNNTLQATATTYLYNSIFIRLTGITDRKDVHVQVRMSRTQLFNYATIYTRRSGSNWYQGDLGSANEGNKPRAHRSTSGAFTLLGFGSFASKVDSMHRLTYSVLGTQRRLWADNRLEVNAIDATAANDIAGNVALALYPGGAPGVVRFDDFVVCSSRTVAISNLPEGYRIRVINESFAPAIISAPASSGATLTIDLGGMALPATRVDVLDPYSV